MDSNMMESMIVYKTYYEAISLLPDEKQRWEAIEGLMRYGFYGEPPESENPVVNMIYIQAVPLLRNTKARYVRAIENGKKGGRPTTIKDEDVIAMKEAGQTNKEIAEHFGCSEKNIEARMRKIKKESEKQPESVVAPVKDRRSESKKNTLEDLDDLALEALEADLECGRRYADLYKEYELADKLLNKYTLGKVRDEKKRREEVEIAINNGTYFDDEPLQATHEKLNMENDTFSAKYQRFIERNGNLTYDEAEELKQWAIDHDKPYEEIDDYINECPFN